MTQQTFDDAMKRRFKGATIIGIFVFALGVGLVILTGQIIYLMIAVGSLAIFGFGLGLSSTMVSYYSNEGYKQ